jgi:capsular exopolysaccharide synthesis family protein
MSEFTMFKNHPSDYNDRVKIEKIIAKAKIYWPLFLICVLLSILIGYIYLRYSTPIYKIHAKVLIKDEKKGNGSEGQLFQDLGIRTGVASVDNEIEIFKSRSIMLKVVRDLQLNVHYWISGAINKTELYHDAPFKMIPLFPDSSLHWGSKYNVLYKGESIELEEGHKKRKINLGDTVTISAGRVVFIKNTEVNARVDKEKFEVTIEPVDATADRYLGGLEVAAVNKQVSIIGLSVNDHIPQRGEAVLNQLIEVYLQANIDDRNKVSDSTIAFINDRLVLVSEELGDIEKEIEGFKKTNELTDIKDQSKLLLDNSGEYARELTQQEVQLKVAESLETYIQGNTHHIVPSTLLVQDISLSRLIEKYNTIQSQRQSLLLAQTPDNPTVANLDQQLENLRGDMKSSLSSIKTSLQVTISELKRRAGYLDERLKSVPQKERIFLEYSRQQNIKQELYLFLLKKREETAISKSATIANARIIEPARKDGSPFAPSRSKVLLTAFAIGILIPGARVLLKELFNLKIDSRNAIAEATRMPILGEIGHNETDEIVVVQNNSRSILSEQFRALRTNLQFLFTGKNDKAILITSSMSGEGKSFIAINLANTIALSNKKVVLLELDLRKPKISEHLNIHSKKGFSDYAVGSATIDEIIVPSGLAPNFYIIPTGAIPPNPAEIIMLPKTEILFEALKEKFDYVIMDTAPVGLVTDAQLLGSHADATLFIVRQNYTYKEQVRIADELAHAGKMPKMSIVVNDVEMGRGSYYGYGYGNYYGNAYYIEDGGNNKNKGIAARLQKIRRGIKI